MDGFFHRFFADAGAPYRDARYVIFGVPYDGTTSFRAGTRDGPRAIRDLSYNFETYLQAYDTDLSDIPVADLGDLDASVLPDDVVLEVEAVTREIVSDGKVPVMLGGEHSITPGAVRAVRPDCYVVCDAHLDLRDEYRGAANSHACATRRVYEDGVRDIVIVGGRSGTREQFAFARDRLQLVTAEEILDGGMEPVIRKILEHTEGKRIYLSVDADVIDSCLTPGLGTPEPFGLQPGHVKSLVAALAPRAAAFDYVEVCPAYDHGQAATVGARIVREFIAAHHAHGSAGR
jgi:agmatinase